VALVLAVIARVPAYAILLAGGLMLPLLLREFLRRDARSTTRIVYRHNHRSLRILCADSDFRGELARATWLYPAGVCMEIVSPGAPRRRVFVCRPAVSRDGLRRLRLWHLSLQGR